MFNCLKSKSESARLGFSVCMALMTAFFLCGVVAGCVTAASVDTSSGQTLSEYIANYFNGIGDDYTYGSIFKSTVINYFKYPAIVFLFGFTALGVICVPAAVCVRGFFISFSVTTIVRMFGCKGLVLALAMFGFSSLITIACLMVISSLALCAAFSFLRFMLNKKKYLSGGIFPDGYFIVSGICAVILLVSVAIDAYITPKLIAAAVQAVL